MQVHWLGGRIYSEKKTQLRRKKRILEGKRQNTEHRVGRSRKRQRCDGELGELGEGTRGAGSRRGVAAVGERGGSDCGVPRIKRIKKCFYGPFEKGRLVSRGQHKKTHYGKREEETINFAEASWEGGEFL